MNSIQVLHKKVCISSRACVKVRILSKISEKCANSVQKSQETCKCHQEKKVHVLSRDCRKIETIETWHLWYSILSSQSLNYGEKLFCWLKITCVQKCLNMNF